MKYLKYIGFLLGIGMILGSSMILAENAGKIADQEEITMANCEEEIENVLEADKRKLYCEESISEEEQVYAKAYSVIYNHRIGDLNTSDMVYLGIDNELNLIMFSIPRAYAFQELEGIEVDQNQVQQEAMELFYQEYGDYIIDAEVKQLQLGTDENEAIAYQVVIESRKRINGEESDAIDVVFVPFHP